MIVKGYKYQTEQDAKNIVSALDEHYGIPVTPDAITQHWAEYDVAYLNDPIFWFIRYDESLEVICGQPTEFEVTTEPITE